MKKKDLSLHCFSPPVMLATMIIETALLIWTLICYRRGLTRNLIIAVLFFLAFFQLAEFFVCEGAAGLSAFTWSRLGFMAITMLPVLGVHLLYALSGKSSKNPIVYLSYAAAFIFELIFLFDQQDVGGPACLGNYVIFDMFSHVIVAYSVYYYGLEIVAMVLAFIFSRRETQPRRRQSLIWLAVSYLFLLIPTTTVNLVSPETIHGIPSIMCGFAVFLAVTIALFVAPNACASRQMEKSVSKNTKQK